MLPAVVAHLVNHIVHLILIAWQKYSVVARCGCHTNFDEIEIGRCVDVTAAPGQGVNRAERSTTRRVTGIGQYWYAVVQKQGLAGLRRARKALAHESKAERIDWFMAERETSGLDVVSREYRETQSPRTAMMNAT